MVCFEKLIFYFIKAVNFGSLLKRFDYNCYSSKLKWYTNRKQQLHTHTHTYKHVHVISNDIQDKQTADKQTNQLTWFWMNE